MTLRQASKMEPETEDPDNNDNLVPWSGSDGSRDPCTAESLAESYYDDEDDASDTEFQSDPQRAHILRSDDEFPKYRQSKDWEAAGEPRYTEFSGSEGDISYHEEDDVYLSESRESITQSPHIQPSPTMLSPHPKHHECEPNSGQMSRPHSHSSSSSVGRTADMTLALTLGAEQPLGANNRQGSGSRSRRVESSEEGGSSEAPPASVFFGISDEGAEQAEKWNSESDTDLCRPDKHRARRTRPGHNESQSERQVKENKSKCKRLAQLLTNAPNPQNKGALLFKRRRQRVEKYTLVSYGTGENKFDSEDQILGESEEVESAEYKFEATSESEFEEDYSVLQQQQHFSENWGSLREMEALPETKGKGVMMFAQRRKRMDQIVSEREEFQSKGIPLAISTEPKPTEAKDTYNPKEMYMHPEASYMDAGFNQHVVYQDNTQQMNNLSNASRPLVPNRTAKPFGFQENQMSPVMPDGSFPAQKRHDPKFKVPVPIITSPQVWSPTGDIIASRDERISVPAIKTGILPEPKRKASNKQAAMLQHESSLQFQNQGERKSYIEPEEDFFTLGAEACNFMQPRTVKLKNPPPVAPKPVIDPNCPPWMRRSPSGEPYLSPRSPVPQPSVSPVGPHSRHYLQQQDWAQSQQMANHWAMDQTQAPLQTPVSAWGPGNSSAQLHLQPTTNSWSQQSPRSPVSMHTHSPTYSPHQGPSPLRNKPESAPQSVASCPPEAGMSYAHESKASQPSPKGQVIDRGIIRAGDGATMKGKGAELFAKRQSRMEKFVVDAEKVQDKKTRSPSPTSSLPNYWRYSSNVRAPPPLSYNPLLSPFHPTSAAKQPPSTSPKIKPKTKEKPKAPPKHLNALDIMKHQPYQLDSSLFMYDAVPEAKCPSPSPNPSSSPIPTPSPKPTPASKFEAVKMRKQRAALSHSSHNAPQPAVESKAEVPEKSPASGFGRSRSLSLPKHMNLLQPPRFLSPGIIPGVQSSFLPTQRRKSCQERVSKAPTPWEAASRSPIGSVDEAFLFQSLPSSVASNVKAAGQRRSLPEPPDEWKRRVSLDPAAVSKSHYSAAPAFQAASISRTFSPEKPTFYGPPFRPAQPLRSASRASVGYMGQ